MPTVTPKQAIIRGHRVVMYPVLIIMGLGWLVSSRFRDVTPLATIAFPVAFAGAWLWWSYMVPRWRDWVIDHGLQPEDVQKYAQATGLIWRRGSIFERTEFRRRDGTRGW